MHLQTPCYFFIYRNACVIFFGCRRRFSSSSPALPRVRLQSRKDDSPESSSNETQDPILNCPHRDFKVRKSAVLALINWTHVASTFVPHVIIVLLCLLVLQLVRNAVMLSYSRESAEILRAMHEVYVEEPSIITNSVKAIFVTGCVMYYLARRDNPTYLLTSQTFEAPVSWKVGRKREKRFDCPGDLK